MGFAHTCSPEVLEGNGSRVTLHGHSKFGAVIADPILGTDSYEQWPSQDDNDCITGALIEELATDHFIEISANGYARAPFFVDLNKLALSSSPFLGNDSWRFDLPAFSIWASGQVPIHSYSEPNRIKFKDDENIIPDMLVSLRIPKTDDKGLVPPLMHAVMVGRIPTRSLGDKIEPLARYMREAYQIVMNLRKRRGSSSQEHFMFDSVAPFIEKHGLKALRELNDALPSFPSSAKYYYPYLLGHLEPDDDQLSQWCVAFLKRYAESADSDIREGAIEALDHLNAA